jgi:hypothetical protein
MATNSDLGDFLQYLMQHPAALIAVAGSYVPVIAAGWGAARFFANRDIAALTQRLDNATAHHGVEVQRLEDLLARQIPLVDEGFTSLNELDPIVVPPKIPNGLKYDPELGVITVASSETGPWHFTPSTHADVFEEWFGDALQTNPSLKAGYQFVAAEARLPCALWKGRPNSVLTIDANPIIKRMYPFIILRRLANNDAPAIDYTTRELVNFITWLAYWDAADAGMRFTIQKLSRSRDFAYLRGYFSFRKLRVNGEVNEQFYLLRQILVKLVGSHRYVIYTGFPNKGFQDPYYDHLRQWWEGFRIVQE